MHLLTRLKVGRFPNRVSPHHSPSGKWGSRQLIDPEMLIEVEADAIWDTYSDKKDCSYRWQNRHWRKAMIHEKAATGFDRAGDGYHRGRPDYPREAIDFIIAKFQITKDTKVVDLGAGTGKFSKLLADRGYQVTAVEPVAGMRAKFKELLPEHEILEGTAEANPVPDESCDLVIVAQAFHWFNGEKALEEIHRILKPEGFLVLIWNARDESVDWVSQLTNIIDPHEGNAPRYKSGKWKEAFLATERFLPLSQQSFRYLQAGPPEMIVDRVTSISFISALPESERGAVVAQVRILLASHPALAEKENIEFPYRTDLFWCEKVGS